MPLYNAQDIQDQFWDHEGIKTELDFEGGLKFEMPYGEFFEEAIDDDSSVAELKLRIDAYLNTQRR